MAHDQIPVGTRFGGTVATGPVGTGSPDAFDITPSNPEAAPLDSLGPDFLSTRRVRPLGLGGANGLLLFGLLALVLTK